MGIGVCFFSLFLSENTILPDWGRFADFSFDSALFLSELFSSRCFASYFYRLATISFLGKSCLVGSLESCLPDFVLDFKRFYFYSGGYLG